MTIDGYGMQRSVPTHNICLPVNLINLQYYQLQNICKVFFILLNIASSSGKARLWRLDTKEIEREYVGHQKAITALAFRD